MLFVATISLMVQNKQDAIIGTWQTDAKDAKMEIFRDGETYYGKLIWGNKIVGADGKTSLKDTKPRCKITDKKHHRNYKLNNLKV